MISCIVHLKLPISLRVNGDDTCLHTRLQFHKLERPTQSGRDYIEHFWYIGVIIIKSFEDIGIKNVSPARECNVRITRVCVCVVFVFSAQKYLTHFSISHLLLLSLPYRFTTHPHARTCTCMYVHTHECSPSGLSITLSRQLYVYSARSRFGRFRVPCRSHLIPLSKSREISKCVHSPSKCVHEIKSRTRKKYSSKSHIKEDFIYYKVIVIFFIRGYFNVWFK